MKTEHGLLGLVAICITVIVFSLAGLTSDFVTRLLGSLDGLLLLMVCLLMGGLFSLMLLLMAKEQGWLPFLHRKQDATHSAAAGNPGPANSGEGK